jgi:hypothetical protein
MSCNSFLYLGEEEIITRFSAGHAIKKIAFIPVILKTVNQVRQYASKFQKKLRHVIESLSFTQNYFQKRFI